MRRMTAMFLSVLIWLAAVPAFAAVDETVETIIDIICDEDIEKEAEVLAKILFRECRGIEGYDQKAAVAWVVLNRVDDESYPNSVYEVATQKHQFAWRAGTPVTDELYDIAMDVLVRWKLEKCGYQNVGRVLPSHYLFFAGRNGINRFRTTYRNGTYWNWELESPY